MNNYSNIEIGYGRADNSWTREPRNITMANNIVVGSQKDLIEIINEPTNFTWSGNIMHQQGTFAIGMEAGTHEINVVDPLLSNANVDSLWLLTSASPAINGAINNYLNIEHDIQGQIRSGTNDVGADEYATSTVFRRPLTPADVGPNAYAPVSIDPISMQVPVTMELLNSYPNPFNPSTTIEYTLSPARYVELSIYNVLGQNIETLVEDTQVSGRYSVNWNAQDLPAGIYLAVLNTGNQIRITKMVLIK